MITNMIYNQNCLDTMAIMPDNYIDLTVTSPPYDNLRTYNGYCFPFEDIAKELYRVTQQGGVLVWVVGDQTIDGSETGNSFRQALYFLQCGFKLHDTMIYQKTGIPFPQTVRYNQVFEYMFVFSKGSPKTFNPILKKNKYAGDSRPFWKHRASTGEIVKSKPFSINEFGMSDNIWIFQNGKNKSSKEEIAFEHPATFPEELARQHIISWSNEGDIVYDPFMGSGTTAKMAIIEGRNYIGSELSAEYCNLIERRIAAITKKVEIEVKAEKLDATFFG